MKYSEIAKTTEYQNDKNCCTVVASSIAFDVPFPEMQEVFTKHGRKRNKGYYMDEIIYELGKKYGYEITLYNLRKKYTHNLKTNTRKLKKCEYVNLKNDEILVQSKSQLTASNFRNYLPAKNYIFGTRGHVLAVKNGAVQDWTENRKHRVTRIWTVEKIGKKSQTKKTQTRKPKHDFSSFV